MMAEKRYKHIHSAESDHTGQLIKKKNMVFFFLDQNRVVSKEGGGSRRMRVRGN